ncbi:mitogen-activated protein kinase kinase kinase NPK1-like isoform X2 [Dendrobium catenatum]|uniref:mitogen-activated protein kinase kinase kinase NPK1-like isoform X2 n=1 Tax=Dendrobium catenatum TaxID=906689 RepID=UPI0010A0AE16|nr:mitogen-activated protein kinase kinase kinase NPK1-like isoform X2 [Dendrobium catenatum]
MGTSVTPREILKMRSEAESNTVRSAEKKKKTLCLSISLSVVESQVINAEGGKKMQDLFGSVRRSFSLRSNPAGNDGGGGGPGSRIVERIGSRLRKSKVGLGLGLGLSPKLSASPNGLSPKETNDDASPIRWRKGELIGCGAFGHVYMGMNLDSGELLAVKQVLLGNSNASKEKAQAHIRELEEEVKLLKNLSHRNIVRYLGTVREEETLNILLEFVPGGSISSLLGKFGSFPEAVIKMYTKQLLQGLEYLHKNGIIHRDIKGANILVDNKGCIKLADFGASKQVAKLATMTAAKSMKGTPYWMAPEVILQTGHTFSADIWSVGCTVIEMATGKPPWSQQYQEVAALFHIGTTKSHPPIPEHLSSEAKHFLLKCLHKEPKLRPPASDLLQHPFVTADFEDSQLVHHSTATESKAVVPDTKSYMKDRDVEHSGGYTDQLSNLRPIWDTNSSDDDMCQIFDKDAFPGVGSSFNPMSEPFDEWPSKFDANPEHVKTYFDNLGESSNGENKFTFPCEPTCEEDDYEVTEGKIRAFLDEKALDLKKLQTPLYEEFFNSLGAIPEAFDRKVGDEYGEGEAEVPSKNSKPFSNKITSDQSTFCADIATVGSPTVLNTGLESNPVLREIPSAQLNERGGPLQDSQPEANSPRRKKWKEELDQELERQREIRLANGVGKFSPLHRCASRKQDRMLFMSPRK